MFHVSEISVTTDKKFDISSKHVHEKYNFQETLKVTYELELQVFINNGEKFNVS